MKLLEEGGKGYFREMAGVFFFVKRDSYPQPPSLAAHSDVDHVLTVVHITMHMNHHRELAYFEFHVFFCFWE
jgi:hypothetical protein